MDLCPWCHVKVVKEKVEGDTTYYRCPKCKHGFTSTVFRVPVQDILEGKEIVLTAGVTSTFWSRITQRLRFLFRRRG